jgi:hypothetical protein
MLKKMFATFLKNVDEKILTTVQKIINKKVKARGFLGLESVKRAVLGFVGFIVCLLIQAERDRDR